MADPGASHEWYCVRVVLLFTDREQRTYEERLTLWQTSGFAAAIGLAEGEARDYADSLPGCSPAGLAQAYRLAEAPGHGAEVFSLMRDSDLPNGEYLTTFFDTGRERQGDVPADER